MNTLDECGSLTTIGNIKNKIKATINAVKAEVDDETGLSSEKQRLMFAGSQHCLTMFLQITTFAMQTVYLVLKCIQIRKSSKGLYVSDVYYNVLVSLRECSSNAIGKVKHELKNNSGVRTEELQILRHVPIRFSSNTPQSVSDVIPHHASDDKYANLPTADIDNLTVNQALTYAVLLAAMAM
eukprot:scaffold184205_cov38-Prasinocladus_malaysianus.AAC.1